MRYLPLQKPYEMPYVQGANLGYPYAGIDGCRAGWFCVRLGPPQAWTFALLKDAASIAALARQSVCLLIDIPMGFVERGPEERLCDREARRLLGRGRASSVFPVPARATLAAGSYREAVECNRRLTGRGISRQAWAIFPKMRTLDALLCRHRDLRGVLRESHPEVALLGLNGGRPMRHNKKTTAGREERLAVLSRHFPPARQLLDEAAAGYLRRQVALDDIIDAMANAVLAGTGHELQSLPERPPLDGQGIPMEIVCRTA